jgi:hypothetical protein
MNAQHWNRIVWLLAGASLVIIGCASGPDQQVVQLQAQLQSANAQVKTLTQQLNDSNSQLQTISQDRDTCTAKFKRATILYDVGILGVPARAWVIPADVEPTAVTGKRGVFSHYDPSTQMETVKFNPKSQ